MLNESKRKKLEKVVSSSDFSGVVSVSTSEKTLYEGCNGYRDRANKLQIDISTRFAIASGTKFFTALGIMRLVEVGKVTLQDKVFHIIDHEFPMYNKDITIEHLLTHTSGLPDYFDEDEIDEYGLPELSVPNHKLLKPSDYLEVMPHKEMKFEPGSDFNYNNSAFVFLAMIIEKVTGDYHQWVVDEVLQKADMSLSGFFKFNELPANTALGYMKLEEDFYQTNIYELPIIGGGDGGMYTTALDMKKFWNALYNGRIISKKHVSLMTKVHSKSKNLSYGLGVWLEEKNGLFMPFIFGQDEGVSFISGYHLNKKTIYVVISNTSNGAWKVSGLLSEE